MLSTLPIAACTLCNAKWQTIWFSGSSASYAPLSKITHLRRSRSIKARRKDIQFAGYNAQVRRPCLSALKHAVETRPGTNPAPLLTLNEAKGIASSRGFYLNVRKWGFIYTVTCNDGGPDGKLVGISSGFTAAPFGLMHCDSLRVYTRDLAPCNGKSSALRGTGLGLLMCAAVIALGREAGCAKAEILAINDDDVMHRRLCRYYRRMGFQDVVEVGGRGLSDLPHLLVWGGPGTRMNVDTTEFLRKWSDAVRSRR